MLAHSAERGFHPLDYCVFLLVLLISIIIGLYYAFTGGKQRTTHEFLMANRELRTLPVALSILVSFVSAILVLGTPAEMYTRGTQLTMRTIGYCFAIFLSSQLLVPLFFSLKVTSSFEYLQRRYNSEIVKLMGTVMMIISNIFYMGLVMYTPSTALQAVTGFPFWASILCTGFVSTLYTSLGGMKAVIWTDVFQSVVMISGMLAIVVQGTIKVGGLGKVWELSRNGGRLIFFNFDPDPTQRLSFWSLVFGGLFSSLTVFGTGQASVQRYCALPTLSQAKRSLYLNIPGILIVNVLASLVGLVIYAYYAELGCDPLKQKLIVSSNQLVPYFVIDVLNYPGVPGMFISVLFSGALSSMSSCLNALSAVTWQDILKRFSLKINEEKRTYIAKILVLLYGMISMCISFGTEKLGVHVLQASLSFTGATSGPTLGMFLLGAFSTQANAIGAFTGCVISLALCLWIAVGAFVTLPYKRTILPTTTTQCLSMISNSSMTFALQKEGVSYQEPTATNSMDNFSDYMTTASSPVEENVGLVGLQKLYGISFLWYGAIGCCLTMIIGFVVSVIINKKRGYVEKVDPKLIIPCWRTFLNCFRKKKSESYIVKEDAETATQELESLKKNEVEKLS